VKAVQRILGHASAATTLDGYSGLFDDDLDGLAPTRRDSLRTQRGLARPPRSSRTAGQASDLLLCKWACASGAGGTRTRDRGIMSPLL
jgi:hypothetical protein